MSVLNKLGQKPPYKLLSCDGGGSAASSPSKSSRKSKPNSAPAAGSRFSSSRITLDYVAGTSTGAIIATLVALGYDTTRIRDFYLKSGKEMFEPSKLWERLHTKFTDDNLTRMLKEIIGEHETLGTDKLKTLLMIVPLP